MKPRNVCVTFANPEDAAWFMHCVERQIRQKQSRIPGHQIGLMLDSLGSASAVTSPDLTDAQAQALREGRQIQ